MNLALNARDAMRGTGGTLTIRTRTETLDGTAAARLPPLQPGPHAVIEVGDTGPGIPPEIRDRIFEPYFTTRTTGEHRGTGLGLSTVYAVVEAHAGSIEVLDVAPRGTNIRVWLPAEEGAAPRSDAPGGTTELAQGSGLVLFVDDEAALRRSCAAALTMLGYEVLVASDGREAVEIVRARPGAIAAVLLDLVMPEMDGRDAYVAMRAIDPELPVVLTTGTPFDAAVPELLRLGVRELLPKPFAVQDLARAVERVKRPLNRDRAPESR
jgi:CheY-like chemotaxis protein